MTDGAAILLLKDQIKLFENGKDRTAEKALVYLENYIEALNMAIEALNTRDSLEKKVTYLTQENRDREIKFKAVRVYRQNGVSDLNKAFEQGWQLFRASEFVPEYSSSQGYIEYILFKEFD